MNCKICDTSNQPTFKGKILNKYEIKYFHCKNCGFLQTEEPYWLEEAYANPINLSDTGYMQRNLFFSKVLTILLRLFFDKNAKFLDYAGGYGVFVRLMRDIGFDFYWDDKFTENIFARGFEYKTQPIEAITTFESFEHFVNPMEEIEKMLSISKNIIFSTHLLPSLLPKPNDWWYYGLEHGQHVSLYSSMTLEFVAKKYGLKYYNLSRLHLHLITEKKISKINSKLPYFSILGLHKIIQKTLKSKTWEDHLILKNY